MRISALFSLAMEATTDTGYWFMYRATSRLAYRSAETSSEYSRLDDIEHGVEVRKGDGEHQTSPCRMKRLQVVGGTVAYFVDGNERVAGTARGGRESSTYSTRSLALRLISHRLEIGALTPVTKRMHTSVGSTIFPTP